MTPEDEDQLREATKKMEADPDMKSFWEHLGWICVVKEDTAKETKP